jgi:glutamate formiminotransferase
VKRPLLLAVPNASEGRHEALIETLAGAFAPARVLDVHADPDHGRSVLSLAGRQGELAGALLGGAREVVRRVDVRRHAGLHPHVGALDVAPIVYLDGADRGAACAEALSAAALIGEDLELPVFLYGELATSESRRERAALRAGGLAALAVRMESGELEPDHGPRQAHPTAGATLVTVRPPLVAFNLDLATADVEVARGIAAELREAGGGLAGVRAMGLYLPSRGRAQVSTNIHDHRAAPLSRVVDAVRSKCAVAEAELVGLVPAAALHGFPEDVPLRGFDPERHLVENALRSLR